MAGGMGIAGFEGGRGADRMPSALRRSASVAAFTCARLERVGRDLGFDVVVLAAVRNPARYAERLSQRRYAGLTLDDVADRVTPSFQDGAAASELEYRVLPFDRRWLGPTTLPSGVSLDGGCLSVALPPGAAVGDLSAVLRTALAERTFEAVARRPGRVRQRRASGRAPIVSPLYALEAPGDVSRVVAVDDVYCFRPLDLIEIAKRVAMALGGLALVAAARRDPKRPARARPLARHVPLSRPARPDRSARR